MLRELHISNLAVIADVRIELSAGLNCFTGATGAGTDVLKQAVMRYLEENPRVSRAAETDEQLDEAAAAKARRAV